MVVELQKFGWRVSLMLTAREGRENDRARYRRS